MSIVGMAGYAGVGKDTAALGLPEHKRVSFADCVRQFAEAIDPYVYWQETHDFVRLTRMLRVVGWERAKRENPDVRRILQRIGTDAGRKLIDEDIWVNMAMRDLPDKAVFTDVRFPNEIEAIKSRGGKVFWIERPGYCPVNSHVSDNAIDSLDCHGVILNNGTVDELHRKVYNAVY